MTPIDAQLAADAIALAAGVKTANEVAKLPIVSPVVDAVNAHVRKFIDVKLGPRLRRLLPLDDAAKLAAEDVAARLADVDAALLVEPSPAIAAGVVEALQTRADVPTIRGMLADLLASACRLDRADAAHVAFVEIVRQLEPEDARVFSYIAHHATLIDSGRIPVRSTTGMIAVTRRLEVKNAAHLAATAGCPTAARGVFLIGNLERLGLIASQPIGPAYDDRRHEVALVLELTPFGEQLAAVCLPDANARTVAEPVQGPQPEP